MRTGRYTLFVHEAIQRARHPEIASVEPLFEEGLPRQVGSKVTLHDGSVFFVRIVGSAPDGGDAHHSIEGHELTGDDWERLPS